MLAIGFFDSYLGYSNQYPNSLKLNIRRTYDRDRSRTAGRTHP